MARYDVRDLLGHWVRPRGARGKMCPHACCRGYRVHPANFPVILPDKLLRSAPERDLVTHLRRTDSERAQAQIIHELDRREKRDKAAAARAAARNAGRRAATANRRDERETAIAAYLGALEADTRGNTLSKAGKRAGITDRQLVTMPMQRAAKYASGDAMAFFGNHPRPTAAALSDRPTRRQRQRRVLDANAYGNLY